MSHEGSTTRGVLRKVRTQIRWNKKTPPWMKPRKYYFITKLPFKRLSSYVDAPMSGRLSAMDGAAQGRVMLQQGWISIRVRKRL